jgi:hypothetical protein
LFGEADLLGSRGINVGASGQCPFLLDDFLLGFSKLFHGDELISTGALGRDAQR